MFNSDAPEILLISEQFEALWHSSDHPPDIAEFISANCPDAPAGLIARLCAIDQQQRRERGAILPLESYFASFPAVNRDKHLALDLVKDEFHHLLRQGTPPNLEEFASRFPSLKEVLLQVLRTKDRPTEYELELKDSDAIGETKLLNASPGQKDELHERVTRDPGESTEVPNSAERQTRPDFIGRYRILRILGDGGFGRVYLAHDDVLNRDVAIKVPHRHVVTATNDIESYLSEARIVSQLDHPSIVPVYDCGDTNDGLCFIVSKHIDGCDLATKIKRNPLSNSASADLVITLAEALHFAHVKGIVHRDVKPANILIDSLDRPYLADFGIALREEDFGTGYTRVGTVAYMSPEQLRGEGHLVDGRSDIFSLGVVLYELITARRPFPSNRMEHATAQIEPRPPRQIDDSIPKELERICLKAMANRVADRYNTAIDMANDLRMFLRQDNMEHAPAVATPGLSGHVSAGTSGHLASQPRIRIVPKGLRSYERDDANFFLELLPGPRDRTGVPESVRFWRSRIQEENDDPFRVGVIYGPSGSGKSSFLKAGVLPLLNETVQPVYIEATPLETEVRLLKAIRKACPDVPHDLGLTESLTAIRRMKRGMGRRKILIVIDQFEQWLHARTNRDSAELLNALRQCDGTHLQCILTVRDDFWMALTQFMSELEIDLVPGNNLAVLNLFNARHAKVVLMAIGQAYGILPETAQQISDEEKAFINKAVAELAENDQIIPVQLALFAEMMKDKAWSLATLKSVGGATGVGETFLEETFNSRTAVPHHRLHQKAARAVLRALLPEGTTGIKGLMKSHDDLLEASGYEDQPSEFNSLLRILDSELRLITPTEPEGTLTASDLTTHASPGQYFHLTHDYLVPSLQSWLTRKQKETRQGRSELVLADRAAIWKRDHSNRALPTFIEFAGISLFASRRAKQEHRQILSASIQYYGIRTLAMVLLIASVGWIVTEQIHRTRAASIVESLANARSTDVPKIVERIEPYRRYANPILIDFVKSLSRSTEPSAPLLHASMALLPVAPQYQTTVYNGLLKAPAEDFGGILTSLLKSGNHAVLVKSLWEELLEPSDPQNADRRFRAGAALAAFDRPEDKRTEEWNRISKFLANQLVTEIRSNLGDFEHWVPAFLPAKEILFPELNQIFGSPTSSEFDRFTVATILARYEADNPQRLTDLVIRSTPREYPVLIAALREYPTEAKALLTAEFNSPVPPDASNETKNQIAKRQAHAAVALEEFKETQQTTIALTSSPDSSLGGYVEDRLGKLNTNHELLFGLLADANTELRAALVRSLAGMQLDHLPMEFRDRVTSSILKIFELDPDAGVHSAAEWALSSWGHKDKLSSLKKALSTPDPIPQRNWYINGQGQTFVVFRGPITVKLGSPADEPGRDKRDESQIEQQIPRDFCICTTEVTVEQFFRMIPGYDQMKADLSRTSDSPATRLHWYRTGEYCIHLNKAEGIPEDQVCYVYKDMFVRTSLSPDGELMETFQPTPHNLSKTGYRTPTEAEWEYACRAGTSTAFSWGSDPSLSSRYARSVMNSNGINWPVGSLCPNRFGLFDMHGNVAEITYDDYIESQLKKPPIDFEEAKELREESYRTQRGGNTSETVDYLRTANRSQVGIRTSSGRLGFRLARTIAPKNETHIKPNDVTE